DEIFLSKVVPEDLEEVRKVFQLSEFGKNPYSLVHRITIHEGEERIIRTESKPLLNEEGICIGMYGILEDLTEWKEAERENLRLSNIIQRSLNEIFMFNT